MSPYRGTSHYHHGRRQIAQDVAEANRLEAEARAEVDARIKAARQAERDRVRLTREDIDGAEAVRLVYRRGWFPVVRVNAQSVTVQDVDLAGRPENVRAPFDRVVDTSGGPSGSGDDVA